MSRDGNATDGLTPVLHPLPVPVVPVITPVGEPVMGRIYPDPAIIPMDRLSPSPQVTILTEGNDRFDGSALTGNLTVYALGGFDMVRTGSGNDTVYGGNGDDSLFGGAGNDLLQGDAGNDSLSGGDGDDSLLGGLGNDLIKLDLGNDSIDAGGGDDSVFSGNLTTFAGDKKLIILGDGNDTLTLNGVSGTSADIKSGTGADVINLGVLNGVFSVSGDSGNDTITSGLTGSTAEIAVKGGAGLDVITAVGGKQTLMGEGDNDIIRASLGEFTVDGGAGHDLIEIGSYASANVSGGDGMDNITFNFQKSIVIISGGSGDDKITAIGNFSSPGLMVDNKPLLVDITPQNTLSGDAGSDTITGGDTSDLIAGGMNNDLLTGNGGADIFLFKPKEEGQSLDVITDFQDGLDKIAVSGGFSMSDVTISRYEGGAKITLTGGETILLTKTLPANLDASDFLFWA